MTFNLSTTFDETGYWVSEPLFEPAECRDLAALFQEPTTARAYAERNLLPNRPEILHLARDPRLQNLASFLLGEPAFPVKATYFDKTPDANWKVPMHQDVTITVAERADAPGFSNWSEKDGAVHVQPPAETLAGLCALRLHLDPCDETNGALRVLPGSHAAGRLGDSGIAEWKQRVPEVVVPVPEGAVMAMRPLLVHASSPSESPSHRRVIHLEYATAPLPPPLRWAV